MHLLVEHGIKINLNLFSNQNEPLEFILINILGKEVPRETFKGNSVFDISFIAEGIYTYHILNSTKMIGFGKLIKKE